MHGHLLVRLPVLCCLSVSRRHILASLNSIRLAFAVLSLATTRLASMAISGIPRTQSTSTISLHTQTRPCGKRRHCRMRRVIQLLCSKPTSAATTRDLPLRILSVPTYCSHNIHHLRIQYPSVQCVTHSAQCPRCVRPSRASPHNIQLFYTIQHKSPCTSLQTHSPTCCGF